MLMVMVIVRATISIILGTMTENMRMGMQDDNEDMAGDDENQEEAEDKIRRRRKIKDYIYKIFPNNAPKVEAMLRRRTAGNSMQQLL